MGYNRGMMHDKLTSQRVLLNKLERGKRNHVGVMTIFNDHRLEPKAHRYCYRF